MKLEKSLVGKRIMTDQSVRVDGILLTSRPLVVASVYDEHLLFLLNNKTHELKEKQCSFFQVMKYDD